MSDHKLDIDHIFHALGDPTRRAMVERLSAGPVSVSQLAAPLNMTLAAVVQHLQILEECGMVRTEKIGRVRTCRVNPKGLDAIDKWIDDRRSVWEKRLDQLGDLLAEEWPLDKTAQHEETEAAASASSCSEIPLVKERA